MLVTDRYLYIGPNRRTRHTAIEWLVELEHGEEDALQAHRRALPETLSARLPGVRAPGGGELVDEFRSAADDDGTDALAFACRLVGTLAVALQRATGHDVAFTAVVPDKRPDRRRLVFEYEHGDIGADAGDIAGRLVAEAVTGLRWPADEEVPGADAAEALRLFLPRAADAALPGDAQALIAAAERLDVPCVKLERDPYRGVSGEFRIRPHGLLKLGHSSRMRIVDGTLCLDRSAALVPLLFDRERLWAAMTGLDLPLPAQDESSRPLTVTRRVTRAAERLGYPVVLKPVKRLAAAPRNYVRSRPVLRDERALLRELERARVTGPQVQVEKFVEGQTWHLLVAGGEAVCAVREDGGAEAVTGVVHTETASLAVDTAGTLDCGLLVLTVVTPDITRPLAEAGGRVVDMDPAPQLDRLLPAGSRWLNIAAERFVGWLYPDGAPSRIPLVAVTGTNGKTTTSRLLARIAKTAGHVPGLASTSGVYIDEELREAGDLAGIGGHHLLFEAREIDFGVLETARGGVAHGGFMFDHCDVGVCINVTPDHIGEYGVDSLADMVAIKRSVLERATDGVVLNADYGTCLDMLPFDPGVRVALCSLAAPAASLLEQAGPAGLACVVEAVGEGDEAAEWLVCHEAGRSDPVLPVADFPASLEGAARFNVSNAQHAIAAARLMGIDTETIARALRSFDASFETNPGRLNVHHGHPFTVIMDYAHNPDGMAQLLDTIDRMGITGRRILMYAATGNRTNVEVAAHTVFPVGRIDHFVVRRYPAKLRGRRPDEIPNLMRDALLEAGVPDARITIADPPEEGPRVAMQLAKPGDLVILSPGTGEFDTMWEQVQRFRPELPGGG